VHDIACVAGVLTYRGGHRSDSLDDAKAIFVTTSGITTRCVSDWYSAQGGRGLSPIMHYLLLSNLAWLKRPASAAQLKLHELVALCAAALRPSRGAWDAFLSHLRKLRDSGVLSSDEVTAIVATDLTDRLLVEEGVDEDSDAATLSEVVERLKASYRGAAEVEINKARQAAQQSEAETLRVRMHLDNRARSAAKVICWALAIVVGAGLLIGTAVTVADTAAGSTPGTGAIILAAGLGVAGLASLLWGFNANASRRWLEEKLTAAVRRWMGGDV
jgi:hypothetical protein